ncbi:hypothetical protein Clacol_000112 [Clathrus columnatus]|uniref:HNH nuclease domain-containing protein n=1 Tax=Clathrus columnatus TaxID=1419009 RepID=A0AAV4ZWM2_9AGAM|nr:hypothetical protein Clacol_000112 [Clathrus columnatus]
MPKGKGVGDGSDNPYDHDYVPEQDWDDQDVEPSAVETTPSSRLERDYGLNEKTKDRVRTNDPNQGRCLIENCSESRSVDFCHCVPRKFTYQSPHLVPGVSVHRLFDNDNYLLLPETKIIQQYHNALKRIKGVWIATRKTFPNIPNGTNFRYKLIPLLEEMEEIAIHRQNRVPDANARPASTDFTTHIYPYGNMPLLQSHIHPKFVILEAGRKITANLAAVTNSLNTYPILWRLVEIYGAWTRAPPSGARDDETYGRPGGGGGGGGDGGDDADTDGGRRLRNGKKRPYPDMGGGGSPTPDSKHGKYTSLGEPGKSGQKHTTHGDGELASRKRKNSICLSEKTLIEHERTFGNKKKWSPETVQVWCKEVLIEQAPPPQLSVE